MAQFELDDQEIEMIVESLRTNEKQGRIGFSARVHKTLVGGKKDDKLAERVANATVHFERFVKLREKFGDVKPLTMD